MLGYGGWLPDCFRGLFSPGFSLPCFSVSRIPRAHRHDIMFILFFGNGGGKVLHTGLTDCP